MNWFILWRLAKSRASGAMMATAKSAPSAMSTAVRRKKIHGISAVRPPTSLTHQLTMTSMTPLFWAKPKR